ncbi:MAG: phosphoribosylformylglycinamidine synthase subunit PurS [Endomicrobia bacterium]|nr:phosphoribosylformylglycinamidine synthase subunit PurS [Endomicrobiia bacterium]MCL2799079.1 phosphoribosylformylglycinamidine synthase subunit PurS [Endomicrobiia bacterium]
MYQIEISSKKGFKDVHGEHTLSEISGLGIKQVEKVSYSQVYEIHGEINPAQANEIAEELLSDKITEKPLVKKIETGGSRSAVNSKLSVIEVWYKKGVTDTVSESVAKAVKDLGIKEEIKVKTGHKYYLYGNLSQKILNTIATKLLANTLIQEYKIK